MDFSIKKSLEILERTPDIIEIMIADLSKDWTSENEGQDTWSAYDIVGHLIHGEKTDWIPRAEIILSNKTNKIFQDFDRFAQFENSQGKSLMDLLHEFRTLRIDNINHLQSKAIDHTQFKLKGVHPDFGEVSLSELISTWVIHDLNHIAQITRVMAKQYKANVGPWNAYLRILK